MNTGVCPADYGRVVCGLMSMTFNHCVLPIVTEPWHFISAEEINRKHLREHLTSVTLKTFSYFLAKFMKGKKITEINAKRFRNFLSDSDQSLLSKDCFLYPTEISDLTATERCVHLSPLDLFGHRRLGFPRLITTKRKHNGLGLSQKGGKDL